jgi:hypothetical protein
MTGSHVFTVSASPPALPSAVHFPIFPSTFIDIQYKYTLWLYIAFCSVNNWLTQALAERTGRRQKAEILILILLDWLL